MDANSLEALSVALVFAKEALLIVIETETVLVIAVLIVALIVYINIRIDLTFMQVGKKLISKLYKKKKKSLCYGAKPLERFELELFIIGKAMMDIKDLEMVLFNCNRSIFYHSELRLAFEALESNYLEGEDLDSIILYREKYNSIRPFIDGAFFEARKGYLNMGHIDKLKKFQDDRFKKQLIG